MNYTDERRRGPQVWTRGGWTIPRDAFKAGLRVNDPRTRSPEFRKAHTAASMLGKLRKAWARVQARAESAA